MYKAKKSFEKCAKVQQVLFSGVIVKNRSYMGLEVLIEVKLQTEVFWSVTPSTLVGGYQY
jgi:hypothetical protein